MDFNFKVEEKPRKILKKDKIFDIPFNKGGFYKSIFTISSQGYCNNPESAEDIETLRIVPSEKNI